MDVFLHQGSPGQTVGGKGAYTKGEIYLAAGQEVYIYVGEAGGTTHSNYIIPSTFNGAVRQDMIKAPPSDPAERAAERRISGLLRENGKIVTQGGASGGLTGYEGGHGTYPASSSGTTTSSTGGSKGGTMTGNTGNGYARITRLTTP